MSTNFVHGTSSLFTLTTPLGSDVLLLRGFKGTEGISRLFRFELDLLSQNDSIDFTQIVGQSVTIAITQSDGTPRYLNGVISRFGQRGQDDTFTLYYAEMVPWLWFLTRTADCRIFQNLSVTDIITQVINNNSSSATNFSNKTTSTYSALEYCVQYRESAFNFISRLMEQYGIFYYFEHAQQSHTMVIADDSTSSPSCPDISTFNYYFESHGVLDYDVVDGLEQEMEMRTGKSTLTDYNFTTPSTSLLTTQTTTDTIGGNTQYETYDYPGKFLTKDDGETITELRMQEEEAIYQVIHGTSNARPMVSGYTFTLSGHYRSDLNTTYLLTDIEHTAETSGYGSRRGQSEEHYSNAFHCIPSTVPFRPRRVTPRPTIPGLQTAVVVGPSGNEIYTDQYGRIKVQFFWDRVGTMDENSSCWIRVAQVSAGKGWGAMFLPRIGQEVVVEFLEGDPDRPLITGGVYNAEQTTPGTLPDKMNVSGWRTHSTTGGGDDTANVLSFDDTKGSEVFYMRAEKDLAVRVENNEDHHVYNNQTITVDNDRTETVTKGNETVEIKQGNRSHTIDTGNESLVVKTGNRSVEVQTGNDSHKIDQGDRTVQISTGNDSLTISSGDQTTTISTGNQSTTISTGNQTTTISMGNQTTSVSLGSVSTTAMQSITLTVGANSITIDSSGVTINGTMVTINGESMIQCQGGVVMIN